MQCNFIYFILRVNIQSADKFLNLTNFNTQQMSFIIQQLMADKVSITEVFRSKWLGIKYVSFEMNGKTITNYEMVFRPNYENKGLDVQSVDIIPIIKYKNKLSQILIIANFRPPILNYSLEFPSGLLEDMDIEANASRELKQETGYTIESFINFPTPKLYLDPWKGNESTKIYLATIDGDKDIAPQQQLQNDENIEVFKLTLNKTLPQQILELEKSRGYVVEGKLWSLCIGLSLMNYA